MGLQVGGSTGQKPKQRDVYVWPGGDPQESGGEKMLGSLVLITPFLAMCAEAKEKQTQDSAMRSKHQCSY